MPRSALAQVSVESNVVVANAFVWRGLTTTNRLVIQPDLGLRVPNRAGDLTIGAWVSVEPSRYDGAGDISAVYGLLPAPAMTQYSAWIQQSVDVRGIGLTAGVETFLYPAVADLAALYNTVELSLSADLPLPFAPSLALWYDVGAVRGAYAEAEPDAVRARPGILLRPAVVTGRVRDSRAGRHPNHSGESQYLAPDRNTAAVGRGRCLNPSCLTRRRAHGQLLPCVRARQASDPTLSLDSQRMTPIAG